jgi:metallo-beta-lactamase family protein
MKGPIFSTPATRDLCAVMLLDSAHIQKRDAEWLAKKKMSFVPPLYRTEDVQEIMRRFITVSYEMRFPVVPGSVPDLSTTRGMSWAPR